MKINDVLITEILSYLDESWYISHLGSGIGRQILKMPTWKKITIKKKKHFDSIAAASLYYNMPNPIQMLMLSTQFKDEDLKLVPNLKVLHCFLNLSISNKGLSYIPNLEKLSMGCNKCITDRGLSYVLGLKELQCGCNTRITNDGIAQLSCLEVLGCVFNKNITYNGLKNNQNLKFIYTGYNNFSKNDINRLKMRNICIITS